MRNSLAAEAEAKQLPAQSQRRHTGEKPHLAGYDNAEPGLG